MGIKLGEQFPNFSADTTIGRIKFHDWLGDSSHGNVNVFINIGEFVHYLSATDAHEWINDKYFNIKITRWGILFSHPADFTPVCTTELARVVQLKDEFQKRGVKMIALSCDSVESHNKWCDDIKLYAKCTSEGFPFPIIADENRDLACSFDMIDPDEKDANGIPLTARAVFIVDQNKKMRLSVLYPATTGRNFDEILRVIDSLQLTDKFKVATPVDWKVGDPVMVQPSVPEDKLSTMFPRVTVVALPSGRNYMRQTPQPN